MQNLFVNPTNSLNEIYRLVNEIEPVPFNYYRVTLEITLYCEVGCAHCKYAPPYPPTNKPKLPSMYLSRSALEDFVDFSWRTKLPALCITGGGEPTHEWEALKYLIREAWCPDITLYTAAQWATSMQQTESHLRELEQCLVQRRNPGLLTIRLSADRYHQEKVPLSFLANVIHCITNLKAKNELYPISVKVRSLLSEDPTVQDLAGFLHAEHEILSADKALIRMPNGFNIAVNNVALTFTGRMRRKQNIKDNKFVKFNEFNQLAVAEYGPRWPLIYKGGLNIGVQPNGKIYLYGGNSRNFGSIYDSTLEEATRRMCCDPITRHALREGIVDIWNIAKSANQSLGAIPEEYNGPQMLIPASIKAPSDHLLVVLRLLGKEFEMNSLIGPSVEPLRNLIGYDGSSAKDWSTLLLHEYSIYFSAHKSST